MTNEMNMDQLQDLLWSFAKHRVLTVAARAGILEELAVDYATPLELSKKLSLDELPTGKIVRALHAMKLLTAKGESYTITDSLREMFAPGTASFSSFIEHSHDMYDRWGENLEPWLKGEPWKTKKRDHEGIDRFGAAMRSMASQIAMRLVAVLDINRVEKMLDVGGGTGTYAEIFCKASDKISAFVLDVEQVAELGRERVRGTSMEDRIKFVGGDYIESDYGKNLDLVLLANILHQENELRAAKIISNAAGALKKGGRVAVLDFSIDDQKRERVLGSLFAINMRSFGDTYPEPVIIAWMKDAGLTDLKRIDIDKTRWVITGKKSS